VSLASPWNCVTSRVEAHCLQLCVHQGKGTAGGREGNGREISGQYLDRMARWHRDYIPEWKIRGVVESGRWGLISTLVTYQLGGSERNKDRCQYAGDAGKGTR